MSNEVMTARPLNPPLYYALQRLSGSVRVANAGVTAYPMTHTVVRNNRIVCDLEYTSGAEHYQINCPYCNDKKQRLWVNYLYGSLHPLTRDIIRDKLNCFNENCLRDFDRQQDFWARVESALRGHVSVFATVAEKPAEQGGLVYTPLPGVTAPINTLVDSEAGQYLRKRHYDLDVLASCYDVRVFVTPPENRPWLQGWIVIPITQEKMPVGWQARYPGDRNWKQEKIDKYFNLPGMRKQLMLYNIDNARQYRTVVVVEGATSTWRVGGPTVALFGKACSAQQRKLLLEWDSIVLMLDADDATAQKKMQELHASLSPHKPTCQVKLPTGKDPGVLSKSEDWRLIRQQAKQQRVPLWLERKVA